MSLVFAGICPHPPLLIPNIGKEACKNVDKTSQALQQMEEELYVKKPDTIVVISPHGNLLPNSFSLNVFPKFQSAFEQFGDFETKKDWLGNPILVSTIQNKASQKNLPTTIIAEEKLDHGVTVPLFFLTNHLPKVKILPIGYSLLNRKQHLEFGELLKDIFLQSTEKVAVIASGDLSHGLSTDAPAGLSKTGKDFDKKIVELLETRNTAGFLNLDESFVEEAAECGYRSILVLLGILKNMNYQFVNLAYEGPFGVGYLTGFFEL